MKTFSGLTGSTTAGTYPASFTDLSANNSTANLALGKILVNDQHRYLLQKYFDNERTVTTTTVGSSSLTTTATLASSAVSATLSVAWANPTGYSPTNFSNGNQRNVLYTKSSTAITWSGGLTSTATTAITSLGFQYYTIPANISKITNDTITVGQQVFSPRFLQTRAEWDLINFLPYNSDIPSYCFIYGNQLGIFPIPSTTGNTLSFNYKARVPDLSIADVTTPGTVTLTAGSTAVVGVATTFSVSLGTPTATDISYLNLYLRADPPKGDGVWYPILSITDATNLVLANPAINTSSSGASYTIAQIPLLSEDFHDMLTYGALMTYFSTIRKDAEQFKQFEMLYNTRLVLLEDYAGTKQIDVNLASSPQQTNPNLFVMGT